jgi:hypothetical protein
MARALPTPPPRPRRVAACLALLLAAGVATPGAARALEVSIEPPRERQGLLIVDAQPRDLFAPRIAESLARGMPATLQLHAELWRMRRGWFDKLESSADASVRIRYEVWSDTYFIERLGAEPIVVSSVDSVAAVLQRPWVMAVGRVGQLAPNARYYVSLSANLRPLTVEDLEEVEGWLSGEVGSSRRREGFGVVTEIPRTLFDAVRNVAGFGDQHARVQSAKFTLRDLFARDR